MRFFLLLWALLLLVSCSGMPSMESAIEAGKGSSVDSKQTQQTGGASSQGEAENVVSQALGEGWKTFLTGAFAKMLGVALLVIGVLGFAIARARIGFAESSIALAIIVGCAAMLLLFSGCSKGKVEIGETHVVSCDLCCRSPDGYLPLEDLEASGENN